MIICQKIIFRQAWVNLMPTSSTVSPWYAVSTSSPLLLVGWRSRCGEGSGDRAAVGGFLFDQCAQVDGSGRRELRAHGVFGDDGDRGTDRGNARCRARCGAGWGREAAVLG